MKKALLIFLIVISFVVTTFSQSSCPPFWNDIQQFKRLDSATAAPKNAILFVGSSSFTRWTTIADAFPNHTIINRGFGGSTLLDVIRYAYDVILPYAPKQIVIYCGENDLAENDKITAADVVQRFKTLYAIIRQNLPQTAVHFVSIKPSPSRKHLIQKVKQVNEQVNAFLKSQKNTGFINVFPSMLDASGNPREELYVEDKLHMKPSGYQLWQKIILPYLIK
jgi:lysophospholipase L1-like esterase